MCYGEGERGKSPAGTWQGTEPMENSSLKQQLSTKDEISSDQNRLSGRGGKPGGLSTVNRNWDWAITVSCDGQKKALFSLSH